MIVAPLAASASLTRSDSSAGLAALQPVRLAPGLEPEGPRVELLGTLTEWVLGGIGSDRRHSRPPKCVMSAFTLLMSSETGRPLRTNRSLGLHAADVDRAALVGAEADRALAVGDLDVEAQLAVRRRSRAGSSAPCRPIPQRRRRRAPRRPRSRRSPPRGRLLVGEDRRARSIIAIIPGVERTRTPIVPPTSVTSRSSTVNSWLFRTRPQGRLGGPIPGWP